MSTKPPRRPNVFTPFGRRWTDERALDLYNTEKLQRAMHARWKQSIWSPDNALDAGVSLCFDKLIELAAQKFDTVIPPHLHGHFKSAIRGILSRETPIFGSIELTRSVASLSLPERVELRRVLRSQEYFLDNEEGLTNLLIEGTVASLLCVALSLPKIEEAKSFLTVPLADMLTAGPANTIERVFSCLLNEEYMRAGLFTSIQETLYANACRANGVEPFTDHKQLKPVSELKLAEGEVIASFLANTPFYDLLQVRVPFQIGQDNYKRHGICVARPGWGKSQLLGLFTVEAINDPDRALILVDPKGPLFAEVKERVPRERLVVIDADTNPPDLNIFDFGVSSPDDALNTFEFLLSSLAGGLSEKQQSCVEPLFALLQKIQGANLVTLHEIIVERTKKGQPSKYAPFVEKLDPILRDFFEGLFHDSDFQVTKAAIQWKISRALGRPAFRKMLSASQNSIDVDRFVREKKIVLVKGGETALGREGMRILLLYLLSQYYAAGKRRNNIPQSQWHLAMLAIDEAHLVLQSSLIKSVLQELRQFNFAFFAATQFWDDVAKDVKPAILGATAIKIIGDVSHDDAEVFARDMHTKGQFIQSLHQVDRQYGEWAINIAPEKKAYRVRCPYGVLDAMPKQKSLEGIQPHAEYQPKTYQREQPPIALREDNTTPRRSDVADDAARKSAAPEDATESDEPPIKPGKKGW